MLWRFRIRRGGDGVRRAVRSGGEIGDLETLELEARQESLEHRLRDRLHLQVGGAVFLQSLGSRERRSIECRLHLRLDAVGARGIEREAGDQQQRHQAYAEDDCHRALGDAGELPHTG